MGPFPDSMQWASPQQRASYLDQQNDAFGKQYQAEQAAKAQPAPTQSAPLAPHQELIQRVSNPPAHVTTSYLDDIVNFADSVAHDGSWGEAATRVGRDVAAGAVTGAANIADTGESLVRNGVRDTYESVAHPGQTALEAEDPAMLARDQQMDGSAQPSPIWEHARSAIMDFRDAVAVKDPNLVDSLTQGVAQLAVPFAGYSKLLSGLHGIANVAAAGAATDASALGPHAMRMADLISLGRKSEGQFGQVLRKIAPDGSALNAYINYLSDRADESEAEGRFKNVLDGFGVNMIATPLLGLVGSTLKQGTAGLRYLIDNGVTSAGDIAGIKMPQAQRGGPKVIDIRDRLLQKEAAEDHELMGALSSSGIQPGEPGSWEHFSKIVKENFGKRPPLRQGYDPAEGLLQEQVSRDADAAVRGGKRPPLRQGNDPAQAIYEAQAQRDAAPHWDNAKLESLLDNARSPLEDDSALSTVRGHVEAHTSSGGEAPVHDVVSGLASHIDDSTEDGAFYKEVLGKLGERNLTGKIVPPGTGSHPEALDPSTAGQHSLKGNTIALYPPAFKNNMNFVHTLAHESVHMATREALADSPAVKGAISGVVDQASQQASGLARRDQYGLSSPTEFVAEAEANPRFQEFLKTTPAISDGRSLWEHYKDAIAGIFGFSGAVTASPLFDKLLTRRGEARGKT